MTVNDHFMLNFHYYEQPFYIFTIKSVYTHVTSGDMRMRTVIRRIFGIRGKTADLSLTQHRPNLSK